MSRTDCEKGTCLHGYTKSSVDCKATVAWDTLPRLALRGITAETVSDLRELRKRFTAEKARATLEGDSERVEICWRILSDIDADLRALLQS